MSDWIMEYPGTARAGLTPAHYEFLRSFKNSEEFEEAFTAHVGLNYILSHNCIRIVTAVAIMMENEEKEMSDWDKLKIGTKVTGFSAFDTEHHDNLIVVAVGSNWAVLCHGVGGQICSAVLEPDDGFLIGEHLYDEDGSLIANVEE